jgi:hypothetical protein
VAIFAVGLRTKETLLRRTFNFASACEYKYSQERMTGYPVHFGGPDFFIFKVTRNALLECRRLFNLGVPGCDLNVTGTGYFLKTYEFS